MGLWAELKRGVGTLRQRSQEATDYAKLRLDKATLVREQSDLLKRLGREVLALHRRGAELPEALLPRLERLERLNAEIGRKQDDIRRSALEAQGNIHQDVPPLEVDR